MNKVYLRQDVDIEPLVDQWYAWPYLLSPAAASMYVKNAHLSIMESFSTMPQIHVTALKNPAMRGGPYVDLDASRASDVGALLARTRKDSALFIELASAIKTLDTILTEEAKGFSIEPLYAKIPEPLRGLVELTYDANCQPRARFLESLFYRSEYHRPERQSISMSEVRGVRPFCFSTPRFEGKDEVHLRVPFASKGLDALYQMRFEPQPLESLRDALGVGPSELRAMEPFFTSESPVVEPVDGVPQGLRIRYLGHACVLLQTQNVTILTDPILSHRGGDFPDHFTYGDLPARIDYVILTHNHQDHCVFETLLELRHRIGTIVVPKSSGNGLIDISLKLALAQIGFSDVVELDELERIELPGGELLALPFFGEHGDLDIRTKTGFVVSLEGRSVMLLADSNNLDHRLYERLRAVVGKVDALFIGMECDGGPLSWLYGPLLTKKLPRGMDQSRRFNGSDCDKAMAIVRTFEPKHVQVYAMGQEPWMSKFMVMNYTETSRPLVESNRLLAECRALGIAADRPYCKKETVI